MQAGDAAPAATAGAGNAKSKEPGAGRALCLLQPLQVLVRNGCRHSSPSAPAILSSSASILARGLFRFTVGLVDPILDEGQSFGLGLKSSVGVDLVV